MWKRYATTVKSYPTTLLNLSTNTDPRCSPTLMVINSNSQVCVDFGLLFTLHFMLLQPIISLNTVRQPPHPLLHAAPAAQVSAGRQHRASCRKLRADFSSKQRGWAWTTEISSTGADQRRHPIWKTCRSVSTDTTVA